MTDAQQREAARQFIMKWKGYEKGETHSFWISLLSDVLGVSNATDYIKFEKPVSIDGHTKFIDGYIADTRILIEQKSSKFDLDKPEPQSGGDLLTPYEQANRYNNALNLDEKARWIVTSNFEEIRIYNMNAVGSAPQIIRLKNLQEEYKYLDFLVKKEIKEVTKEQDLSIQAGRIVGEIYNALHAQYKNPDSLESLRSLNALCVRLVFCMYAEDAGIFDQHDLFYNYMSNIPANRWHRELRTLFAMLNTKIEDRDGYDPELEAFPYVNGGLFSDDHSEIPAFTEEIIDLILKKGCKGFNWRDISPTIFGAVFESTLNPETRRSGGMHYTSIENIHRVIDPLFLDSLKQELSECKQAPIAGGARTKRMQAFQNKLASLTFLDPACGSGNFLTETYLSIRRLENEVIRYLKNISEGQMVMDELGNEDIGVKVSIEQFYGIEINDFAVSVAKTAMWIAEAQMLTETKNSHVITKDFLPLTTNANIHEANAVEKDWNEVIPAEKLNFIMGNPPFVGARMMEQGSRQKREVEAVFGKIKDVQDLDYVCCWYKKAAEYMQGTEIETGFVSTNSICQGSQVPILWDVMLNIFHVHINFAHQTFKWSSESNDSAAVYCVIVGFSCKERQNKELFYYRTVTAEPELQIVNNISPYLFAATDTFVTAQKNALWDVPKMSFGNQPRDGGHFVLSDEEKAEILIKEPELEKWIHPYIGAEEFINGKTRWCLWLKNATPSDIKSSKILYAKVNAVREFRLASRAKTTNGYARVPNQFAQITQPEGVPYLMVPSVSSERRRYIPIGFVDSSVISSNAVQIVPNATLFHFAVLTSNVHMAWMRTVAGRLEMRYRYSKEIVYNTFPWPDCTDDQKKQLEKTAQAILDARSLYPNETMANLYDPSLMPEPLRKAHDANNRAVMRAYGFSVRDMSEEDCVAALMRMYSERVGESA